MPVPNGRNVSAKPGRSKSTSSAGKLPPVVSHDSRERAEAVKKAFDRPKTAHRNSRPPTSTYALPSFGNGRLPSASKNINLLMRRSNSESRALPKIEYGRDPSKEKLADLKDELFQTKKKVANYELDFKKLNTEMKRLKRDAEKRETFLERIVTAQYHPTELNDAHLARTLTNIKQKEMAKENLIEIQHKELERLRSLLKESDTSMDKKLKEKLSELEESGSEEESDYPEEPAQMKSNGILKSSGKKGSVSTADNSVLDTEDEIDDVFELPSSTKDPNKNKERKILAKQYADQNSRLKEKLKEVSKKYLDAKEKSKRAGEEFVKQNVNSKAVVEKTVEISSALELLQKERDSLMEDKLKSEEKIKEISHELVEAYGEIDALKMENERLNNNVFELEGRVGKLHVAHDPNFENENAQSINIPRLDMTDIDNAENCTLHEFTERSASSQLSEFDHDHLAGALAEIAGAHCERLKMITQ